MQRDFLYQESVKHFREAQLLFDAFNSTLEAFKTVETKLKELTEANNESVNSCDELNNIHTTNMS